MITVLGSANVDFTTNVDRLPKPGETILGTAFSRAPGGKGANQALAALRAGSVARLAGRVGDDGFATEAVSLLREAGADLTLLKTSSTGTGTAHITVASDGENSIVVVPGANYDLDVEDASDALRGLGRGDVLLLQLEIPAAVIEQALNAARSQEVLSVLNLSPITGAAQKLGRLTDVLVVNETEFELYAGVDELSDSDRETKMIEISGQSGQTLVVTLGANGVVAARDGRIIRANGLKIKPVDTVGAGDTFCGYLAAGLGAGLELELALRHAAVAGSLACLGRGAQPSIPCLSDVVAAMEPLI